MEEINLNKNIDMLVRRVLRINEEKEILKEQLDSIETICITASDVEDGCEDIKKLANLKECTLINIKLTKEILETIFDLDNLEKIVFDYCELKDEEECKKVILGCKSRVSSVRINNKPCEILKIMMLNEEIRYYVKSIVLYDVEFFDLGIIKNFDNLEYLEIINSKIKNEEELVKMKNINTVKIKGTKLENEEILERLEENVKIEYDEDMVRKIV